MIFLNQEQPNIYESLPIFGKLCPEERIDHVDPTICPITSYCACTPRSALCLDLKYKCKLSKIPGTKTELTSHGVSTWEESYLGVIEPTACDQKTALRYRLAHQSEWELEIARYDSYGDPKKENVPVGTNWGATLYNTYWDSVLAAISTLGIGEAARFASSSTV